MITQKQIVRLGELQNAERELKSLKEEIKKAWKEDPSQESGPYVLNYRVGPTNSVAYKAVVERIAKLHPELSGAITRLVSANTTPTENHTMSVTIAVFKEA